MVLPTIAGLVNAPLKVLSATDTDTFTAQEFVDASVGTGLIAAGAMAFRDRSVVRKTSGEAAYKKFVAAKAMGVF
jgi:hypothetical protein